jgi:glycosyltransferase involved in cell wall biosynthesis
LDLSGRLARSALPFLAGGCLNLLVYRSGAMRRAVERAAAGKPFDAAVVYTLPMAPYVPAGTPFVLDIQDLDSEKWFQYASRRKPGFLYRWEATRLRREEVRWVRRSWRTFFVTRNEEALFRRISSEGTTGVIENGWSAEEWDGDRVSPPPDAAGRRYLVFVGTMSYFPNADGVAHFAREVFPELRRRDPSLEFLVAGRDPRSAVRALASRPGISVLGAVDNPRAYVKGSLAAVAPLNIARGVQMKAVEALLMGKPVLASDAVGETFGELPPGVIVCRGAEGYWAGLHSIGRWTEDQIRSAAWQRFDGWSNLEVLEQELAAIAAKKGERE